MNNTTFDLWEATITDGIEPNHDYIKTNDEAVKKIAALIRKEIKTRFPMIKASVRYARYHSIDVDILSGPFAKDSEELKAIAHYIYKFAQSYNYDNSDLMTDYFDVGFYGVYESSIISYAYTQTPEDVTAITTLFSERKAKFEEEEKEREEKEFQARLEAMEIERKEAEQREAKHEAEKQQIIKNLIITDVAENQYFLSNLIDPGISKAENIEKYEASGYCTNTHTAKISKELRTNKETYNLFCKHLLDDFDFFTAECGGTATDDNRINSLLDFSKMSKEEQKTVKFYSVGCFAVYCENELKFVINTEGYTYARYVYLCNDDTVKSEHKATENILTDDEAKEHQEIAKSIEAVVSEAVNIYGKEQSKAIKKHIKEWAEKNNYPLCVEIVRAIKDEYIKGLLYDVITEVDSLPEQFAKSNLEPEQKITIISLSSFGGLSVQKAKFKSAVCGAYAQYKNAVKLIIRPEKKKQDYFKWLYSDDVLIFSGWYDVPENIIYNIHTENGITTKKSKYLSFDKKLCDDVLNYFASQNIKPVINSYKPQFEKLQKTA